MNRSGRLNRRRLAVCSALLFAALSGPAAAQTVLDDPLDGSTIGAINGGQFVTGGWQAPGQISWDLGQPITEGGMSVKVTNWNPDATSPQHQFDKQHIINMYESSHGSPHSSDGDVPKTDFFNIRTGASYDNFFKFLSSTSGFDAPPEGRLETRVARDPGFIDPNQTYELSVTWTQSGDITAKLDGNDLVTHSHGQPFKLQHVFIGTDNAPAGTYGPQSDVIYSSVQVWGTSEVPDAGTGGSGGTAGSGGSAGGSSTFNVVADTWSDPTAPAATHGSDPDLRVGGDGRTIYLRFVVSGVGHVTNARILLETMNGGIGGDIHEVDDDTWDEATLSHASRPAPSSTVLSSLGAVDIAESYSFDVTPAIVGDGIYSFAITSSEVDGSGYNAKESSGEPPQLVVSWEPGGAGGTGGSAGSAGVAGAAGWSEVGGQGGSGNAAGTGGASSGDAGPDAGAPPPAGSSGEDDGCGCSVPSSRGSGWFWPLLLVVGFVLRRTRQGS